MSVQRSWSLRVYLVLAWVLTPLWRWVFKKRLQRGKETPRSLAQKWVSEPAIRPEGPLVWGHAVGVGEAMALSGLFARMGQLWPQANFLITTTARTSGDALHKTGLPPRCIHQFAPVDTPQTVRKFLDHWQPLLAVWCEMDLWPVLIHATAKRGIVHALVNVRLNPIAISKRRWGHFIYRALLPGFSTIWTQNAESRDGLIQLGAPPDRVRITGTIKSLAPPLACDYVQLQAWQKNLGGRPVWLLASSHPGEEALALQAHALLRQQFPDALLVIAPRAPARGPELMSLCSGSALLRSTSSALPASSDSVYVADTIGEMGLWYSLARAAMIGGSWAKVGGHNPYEPLALACKVIHGPHIWNFAESYAELDARGLSQIAIVDAEIAKAVSVIWEQNTHHAIDCQEQSTELLKNLICLVKT